MAKVYEAKITDLIPDDKNANKHTPRGQSMLETGMRKLGAGRSVLIDKNRKLIGGNLTQEVAVDIGLEDVIIVPSDGTKLVAVQRTDIDLDTPEGRALAVSDNRVAQVSIDLDGEVLAGLQAEQVDLSWMFYEDELAALIDPPPPPADPGPQIDRADELQAHWQVKRGDLWQIGKHRLMCGDSTNADDVARVMGGDLIDCLLTDPPYSSGGMFRSDRSKDTSKKYVQTTSVDTYRGEFTGDNKDQRSFLAWSVLWLSVIVQHSKRGAIAVVFSDWRQIPVISDAIQGAGYVWRNLITWWKPGIRMQRGRYSLSAEYLVYGSLGVPIEGEGSPQNVLQFAPLSGGEKDHIAEKPSALLGELLSVTKRDAYVFDPFLGSGTTLVACEQTGRIGRGIEIEPKYCAVTLERLAQMGLTPGRIS